MATKLISIEDLSEQLGIPVATLYKWSAAKKGPAALKVGKYLRYREVDVEAYIESLLPKSNVTPIRQSA